MDPTRAHVHPLHTGADLDPLLARAGEARCVLVGEATHGTAEFYRWRAALTRRLIAEHGFSFVAVEGDRPDCHRVHCSVTRAGEAPEDPATALDGFRRWPTWLWANEETVAFTRWLRAFNAGRARPVGFHGLDVYSLWDSLQRVTDYLAEHQPDQLPAAREAFRCFDAIADDPHAYARATHLVPENCRDAVIELLARLRSAGSPAEYGLSPGFVARQNAEVVAGAEQYYRTMVGGGPEAWNIRDTHMTDTLDRLLAAYGSGAKAVVWAHNTHVGDATATDMAQAGMVNIGELVRRRHPGDSVAVGFGTHHGTVLAADRWGGEMRDYPVPSARSGSLEDRVHQAASGGDSLFVFDEPCREQRPDWFDESIGHRAIGVVYSPDAYVSTVPARRYDAFIHCDETTALRPLHTAEPAASR